MPHVDRYARVCAALMLSIGACSLAGCAVDLQREVVSSPIEPPTAGEPLWSEIRPLREVPFMASAAASGDELPWRSATEFELSIRGSQCYGACPVFQARVNEAGQLHVRASLYTARPGSYDTLIPADAAQQLYRDVLDSGFLHLRDRYVDAADGCIRATDHPTYGFSLRIPGEQKDLEYYVGCYGRLPELPTLTALGPHIEQAMMLEPFLAWPQQSCSSERSSLVESLAGAYVLYDARDTAVGVLRFEPPEGFARTWHVATCDGAELASGDVVSQSGCESLLMNNDDTAFAWPDLATHQSGAVVLATATSQLASSIVVRLLTLNDETRQRGKIGNACSP